MRLFLICFVCLAITKIGAGAQPKVNLSTPTNAIITCRKAFQEEDLSTLNSCLSMGLKAQLKKNARQFIQLWRMGFEACGGWDRKAVEVLDRPKEDPSSNAYPNHVYVYFTPAGGCQSYLKAIKESDGWKFDER